MASLASTAIQLKEHYWPLIKSRQTFLLALTGLAGYLLQPPDSSNWLQLISLVGSLLLTISGCTVLNMLFDRDIDRRMARTRGRPLVTGNAHPFQASAFGLLLLSSGLLWAGILSPVYFLFILAGAGLNVLVYTLWLKRCSAWSIVLGGLAGGMPILAGRVLSVGYVDVTGLLMAAFVVAWIPSHNLTLSTLYYQDYLSAGLPTFINVYGLPATGVMVILSSLLAAVLLTMVSVLDGFHLLVIAIILMANVGLLGLAVSAFMGPVQQKIQLLFRYSSIYMLGSMLLLMLGGLG